MLLGDANSDLSLGPVRLVSRRVLADELVDDDALLATLSMSAADRIPPPAGQHLWVQRRAGTGQGGHAADELPPCWAVRWDVTTATARFLPRGRLFNAEYMLFFSEIASASAAWSYEPEMRGKEDGSPSYRVLIPDPRAYFHDLVARDGWIEVAVGGDLNTPLYCVGSLTSIDGRTNFIGEEVLESRASVTLPFAPKRLSLYLFDEHGHEYDWFEDHSYRARVGDSLYDLVGSFVSGAMRDLEIARDGGESDVVEFKPGIIPARKGGVDKVKELLETVVAFANARGGVLYLGVSKYGDVVGVESALAALDRHAKGDMVKRRDLYVSFLSGLIAEGVQPTLVCDLAWVEYASLSVVRLTVPAGAERPYVVAENDAILIRRGATNRRATRADILALSRVRSG